MGDKLALWPISSNRIAPVLNKFEAVSKANGIDTLRFDDIITNSSDQRFFYEGGLLDAFTITSIAASEIIRKRLYVFNK